MSYPYRPARSGRPVPLWQQWPNNLRFRPPGGFHRKGVKGGRWQIRKNPSAYVTDRWRAWTTGKAKRWNRHFATHAEAVTWAAYVAGEYATWGSELADIRIRERRRIKRERQA